MADDLMGLVTDEFEVRQLTRIGFRELYYFPFDNKSDTESWLNELGVFSVSATMTDSFKGKQVAAGLSLVFEGEDCCFRIGLNGIETAAQVPVGDTTLNIRSSGLHPKVDASLKKALMKRRQRQVNSAFAAVLDIDAYRIDPVELDIADFIKACTKSNLERFRGSIPPENAKKGK